MVQSVELVLDPALEERVRSQWRALVDDGEAAHVRRWDSADRVVWQVGEPPPG